MFYFSFMYGGTNFDGGVSILIDFSFKNGATNFFGDENTGRPFFLFYLQCEDKFFASGDWM